MQIIVVVSLGFGSFDFLPPIITYHRYVWICSSTFTGRNISMLGTFGTDARAQSPVWNHRLEQAFQLRFNLQLISILDSTRHKWLPVRRYGSGVHISLRAESYDM